MHACINALPDDVGKIFVRHFFSTATKQHAENMLLRLKLVRPHCPLTPHALNSDAQACSI